ncbi:hypothetical protein CapIbe_015316 [Capra ibex]
MDRSKSGCLRGLAGRFCRKCKSAEGGVSSWEDSLRAAVGAGLGIPSHLASTSFPATPSTFHSSRLPPCKPLGLE